MAEPICSVHLACNEPHNGNFTGWAPMVEIDCDGDEVELVHPDVLADNDSGITVKFEDKAVRLGGEFYRHQGRRSHVGNWCWDMVTMTLSDGRRLVAQLLASGFRAESGTVGGVFDDLVNAVDR
jgi:hypothetical protein